MTLEPDDLREKGVHNKNSKHKAMFDGQGIKAGEDYYLVDYRFVPDNMKEEVKSRQIRLFDPII